MAFPAVQTTSQTSTSATTSHVYPFPSGSVSGDLLIIVCEISGGIDYTSTPGFTAAATTRVESGGTRRLSMFYRRCDGTESGTVTFGTDANRSTNINFYRISGHHASTNPEGTSTIGTGSGAINPPSHTPSYGAEDTLWIACGSGGAASAAPTSYGSLLVSAAGFINSAQRNLNATSDDPGTFSVGSGTWAAATIAIRPSAGITGTGSETAPVAQIAAEGGVYRQSLSWVTIA